MFCLGFLILVFVSVNWGKDTILKKYFYSPAETMISEGSSVTVKGMIDRREKTSDYQILYLKNCSIYYQNQIIYESSFIIYDTKKQYWKTGTVVEAFGAYTLFESARNPGNFSSREFYQIRKVYACMWTDNIICVDDKRDVLKDSLSILREKWSDWILKTAGEEYGGMLCAVILGEKHQMTAEMKERFQINGIAHILAISGLHLSFVGLGFYRFVRRMTGSYTAGGIAGMVFLLLYILMIGTTVSAVRAVIMFCIRVGADMSGRVYDAPTSAAAAAAGIILWRPLAFYDAGFQLSFGAILGILFVFPAIKEVAVSFVPTFREKKISVPYKWALHRFSEAVLASLSIQITTLPVILWHYYQIPSYGVLLNLVVIPLMSVLLAAGFVGSVLGVAGIHIGVAGIRVCQIILKFYEEVCIVFEKIPGHHFITGRPEMAGIITYYGCLIAVLFFVNRLNSKHRINEEKIKFTKVQLCVFASLSMICLASIWCTCPENTQPDLEITFLDVGQGDGIFIREKDGMTCLIDGGSSDVAKVGQYRIEPFLKSRGVSEIDYVFVTHGDEDHICGIEEMIRRQNFGVRIGSIVFPDVSVWDEKLESLYQLASSNGIRTVQMKEGESVNGKELHMKCLAPGKGLKGNEASLVIGLSYHDLDVLFTGDVEGNGEEMLVDKLCMGKGDTQIEILKAAHHGSKYSTSEEFLEIVRPKLCVISAGRKNLYGHPHEETMKRLEQAGAACVRTDECGAVTVRVRGEEVAVISHLISLSRRRLPLL
ncbi:MAG: DNA internalization-related competence protein ComEC/Rec2 [Eubacteriales bacterium]|nr:DNA internalization-related competence protein ComEC/Rec2 [Eubacteriales bacterium]